jgi:hypothetical protein
MPLGNEAIYRKITLRMALVLSLVARGHSSWWYASVSGDWHPDRETCFMDAYMQKVASYHNICEEFLPYECSGPLYNWEILP